MTCKKLASFKPNNIFFSKFFFDEKSKKIDSILFFAADEGYFNLYGRKLIRSLFKHNKSWGVHVHLYDPSKKTLNFLNKNKSLTYSYEILNNQFFMDVLDSFLNSKNISWQQDTLMKLKAFYRSRFCNILARCINFIPACIYFSPKKILIKHFRIIYFACQRFVILNEIIKNYNNLGVLSLDADSLINKALPNFSRYKKYDISIAKSSCAYVFMAGVIWMPHSGRRSNFLDYLSKKINNKFSHGQLYWGLDQDLLTKIVPKFKWQNLEPSLRCFDFFKESSIWLAKGTTKHSKIFMKQYDKRNAENERDWERDKARIMRAAYKR